MKTSAVALIVLLAGCSVQNGDAPQIAALQKQVDALSSQVQVLNARSSAADNLDLQSKCTIDAKRTFELLGYSYREANHGGTDSFVSHYNAAMQRCFMVITDVDASSGHLLTQMYLLDANEQLGYGTWTGNGSDPIECTLTPAGGNAQGCKSEQEFDQYVVRYMGAVPR
ncbi:hypothetical protein ABQJ54_02060 [Rhodanobacter sp. Si-c]|uniref:DUF3347 domain-containing protein n=1 Tax=Rhodanobacter lycopersici TaxID=3162487 RepID=A0ABV3Q9P0_9GAMM